MANTRPYNRKYYVENKEKILAARQQFYLKNREKRKEWGRNHYEKNKLEILAKTKEKRKEIRETVLTHYGKTCQCCGETIDQFLCIDHMDNNGASHRKEIKVDAGMNFYRWIIKNNFPNNLQVLCYNCSCAKGFFGKCPHKQTLTTSSI